MADNANNRYMAKKTSITVRIQAATGTKTSRDGVLCSALSTEKSRAQAASRIKVALCLQTQDEQFLFSTKDAVNAVVHHKKVSFG